MFEKDDHKIKRVSKKFPCDKILPNFEFTENEKNIIKNSPRVNLKNISEVNYRSKSLPLLCTNTFIRRRSSRINKEYKANNTVRCNSAAIAKNSKEKRLTVVEKKSTVDKSCKENKFVTESPEIKNNTVIESPKEKKSPANIYGEIQGVSIGTVWNTRIECAYAKVHRQTIAGIHPGKYGAYSVVLSGNYEDDLDNGHTFTYTVKSARKFPPNFIENTALTRKKSCGGRDFNGTKDSKKNLRIIPQSKDQMLNRFNLSLIKSIDTKNPVRVVRGYKLNSPFAPDNGYRYDGLYTVEKYSTCTGKSKFLIYKFFLKRCENQSIPPWDPNFKHVQDIKKSFDDSNKENTIINFSEKRVNYSRTRRSDSTNNLIKSNKLNLLKENKSRECKRKSSFIKSNLVKKKCTTKNLFDFLISQPFELDIESKSVKWFLFAKEDEQHYLQNVIKNRFDNRNKCDYPSNSESFKGFNQKGPSVKLVYLGFLIHDLKNKLEII